MKNPANLIQILIPRLISWKQIQIPRSISCKQKSKQVFL